MRKFKAGDIVRCVDRTLRNDSPIEVVDYQMTDCDYVRVRQNGILTGGWLERRFELAEESIVDKVLDKYLPGLVGPTEQSDAL